MRKQNVGLGKRIAAFMLASILFATSMDYSVFADETQNTTKEEVETQSADVTFMNDGYPYGKDMTSSSVTFVMDVEENASSYQWQSADSKDGSYTDITGATQNTYTTSDLKTGKWYRCVVDETPSKAVEVVKPGEDGRYWTASYSSSWYISNGTMAYMTCSSLYSNIFDVTGLYEKNNNKYMLQTSYNQNWQLYSDSNPTPNVDDRTSAKLDAFRVAFNEKDDYDVIFEADLADDQQAFSFGCDTQLGNSSTSGSYSDYAALKATTQKSQLKKVAMIGAKSVDTAAEDDPAFVITPITVDSMFWIGYYSARQTYSYNTANGDKYKYKKINDENVVVYMEQEDSGMTMSWKNVPSGGSVKFQFGVGSVKSTGAVSAKVDYSNEKITGLEANTTYTISADDSEYTITSDGSGQILLSGTDNNGKSYNFIGTDIEISKNGAEDDPAYVEVAGRPEQPQNPSELGDATEKNPELDEKIEIAELGTNYVKISPKTNQQYAYSVDDGQTWTIITDKDSSGNYVANNLPEGKSVKIRTRIAATDTKPASEWSEATELTLMQTLKVTARGYNGVYDGKGHSVSVTPSSDVSDVTIKYSLAGDSSYTTDELQFTNAGRYKIYYRVEKEGYYPSYGYVYVDISQKPVDVEWSNTEFTYNGSEQKPTADVSGLFGDDTCDVNVLVSVAAVNAGTYTAYARLSNSNYTPSTDTQSTTFTIKRADQTAPVLTATPETISGKADGKINGLTTAMEYCKVTDGTAGVASAASPEGYISVTEDNVNNGLNFEAGTYHVRYRETQNYNASADAVVVVEEGEKFTMTLPEESEQTGYILTAESTQIGWNGSAKFKFELKPGYSTTEDFKIQVNGNNVTLNEDGTFEIKDIQEAQKITVTGVADKTAPTGKIKLGETDSWRDLANKITFGLFFNDRQEVTISAADEGSGVKSISYYVEENGSDTGYNFEELRAFGEDKWQTAELKDNAVSFDIDPDKNLVIYAKLVDNAGNVSFISSDGMKLILDKEAPVISGYDNDKTYCHNIKLTVEDAYLDSVKYQVEDGEATAITAVDGKYIIPVENHVEDNGEKKITVIATDKAGNISKAQITVSHNYDKETVVEPTVLEKGYTEHFCTNDADGKECNKSYKDNYTSAIGSAGLVPNDKEQLQDMKSKANEKLTDESLSEEDKIFYQDVSAKAEEMLHHIEDAANIIKEIDNINVPAINNPTADDSEKLNDALTKIDDLLNADNPETPTQSLTDEQKSQLEKLKESINEKLAIIDKAAAGIEHIKNGDENQTGVDKINAIEEIKAEDQSDIEAVIDAIDELFNDYGSNLTEEQKNTVNGYKDQMLDKLKEAASKAIDDKLEVIKKEIEVSISDSKEKAAAIENAKQIADEAKESISAAAARGDIVSKCDEGKLKLDSITGDADTLKEAVKANIESIFNEKKKEIENMTDLTDEEKQTASDKLEEEKQTAFDALDTAKSKDDLIKEYEGAVSSFDEIADEYAYTDLSNAKDSAKSDIDKQAENAKKRIDAMTDLTDSEKADAKAEVDKAASAAKEKVDAIKEPAKKPDISSSVAFATIEIAKKNDDAADKNETNAAENKEKIDKIPEETTTTVIDDVAVRGVEKADIISKVKESLKESGLESVDVDIDDFKKVPATLHEKGRVTGTIEMKSGSATKLVPLDKELPELSSYVSYESKVSDDVPKTDIAVDESTLMDNILSEEAIETLANGGSSEIKLVVSNKETEVDETDKKLISGVLADSEQIGKFLDISLFLNVLDADDNLIVDNERIHNPDTKFTIKMDIPKDLISSDSKISRTYQIVRIHDGEAQILESTYDGSAQTISFETDRFSTYAITYTDTEEKSDITENPSNDNAAPDTDNTDSSTNNTNNTSKETTTDNAGSNADVVTNEESTNSVQAPKATAVRRVNVKTTPTGKKYASPITGDNTPGAWGYMAAMVIAAGVILASRKKKSK